MTDKCKCPECSRSRMDEMSYFCIKCETEGCTCDIETDYPEARCD